MTSEQAGAELVRRNDPEAAKFYCPFCGEWSVVNALKEIAPDGGFDTKCAACDMRWWISFRYQEPEPPAEGSRNV